MAKLDLNAIPNKTYYLNNVNLELDNGYGIESVSYEVIIEWKDGQAENVTAFGLHFQTDQEVAWDPRLTDLQIAQLIENEYELQFAKFNGTNYN